MSQQHQLTDSACDEQLAIGAEVFLETSDDVELPQLQNHIAERQEMLFNIAGVLLVNDHEHVNKPFSFHRSKERKH